ncbi:AAA family ATPase [Tsukamurella pulmonis]|uniref:AAA family ATPase n=1 Tax=Tsukamurella pulmonis TaxID=47312 RepID=UPI000E092AC2|nr:AAA family ATPase [Tsukamurella pulmonis]RDH12017.1 hypothetical protein DVB88_09705 [Tsukamurella pulmonis]
MSNSDDNTYDDLFAAMVASKAITEHGAPAYDRGQLQELQLTFNRLDGDSRAALVRDARDGASLHRLRGTLLELERTGAREDAARLRPAVSPIDVSPGALGTFDMSIVGTDPTPPRGPWVGGLFPATGLTLFTGPGGTGKTWGALRACQDAAEAGVRSVYLDADCNGVGRLAQRLILMGCDPEYIRTRAVNLVDPADVAAAHRVPAIDALAGILRGLESDPPAVIVIDSFAKALAASGASENDAADVNRLYALVERLRSIACVIVVDHTGHEFKGRPRGASAKIDTPDTVVMLTPVETEKGAPPPDPAMRPVIDVRLSAVKDRHGALGAHLAAHVAPGGTSVPLGRMRVVPSDRDGVTYDLVVITEREGSAAAATAAASVDAQRAAACDRAVYDAGTAGMTKTALVRFIEGLADPLGMPRDAARVWAAAHLDARVADGSMDEHRNGNGHAYTWIGATVPTGDAADDHAAFVNGLMGGGDAGDESADHDDDDANAA